MERLGRCLSRATNLLLAMRPTTMPSDWQGAIVDRGPALPRKRLKELIARRSTSARSALVSLTMKATNSMPRRQRRHCSTKRRLNSDTEPTALAEETGEATETKCWAATSAGRATNEGNASETMLRLMARTRGDLEAPAAGRNVQPKQEQHPFTSALTFDVSGDWKLAAGGKMNKGGKRPAGRRPLDRRV